MLLGSIFRFMLMKLILEKVFSTFIYLKLLLLFNEALFLYQLRNIYRRMFTFIIVLKVTSISMYDGVVGAHCVSTSGNAGTTVAWGTVTAVHCDSNTTD